MNEKTSLEHVLESWSPRGPSPGLERRIFGDPLRAAAPSSALSWSGVTPGTLTAWMVPATAFAFALCCTLTPTSRGLAPAFVDAAQVAAFEQTPIFATLQTAPVHSAANSLPAASFTWTNLAQAHSTNASVFGDNPPF